MLGGAVIAAALAFWLPAGQGVVAGIAAVALVLICAVSALNASPASIAFVGRHGRAIRAIGGALVVLGVAIVVVAPFYPYPAGRFGLILYVATSLSLTGFMTARLPQLLKDVDAVRAEADRQAGDGAGPDAGAEARPFDSLSEGLGATASVIRNAGAVFHIVGPWVLLLVVSGLIAVTAANSGSEWPGRSLPVMALLALPLALLLVISAPTVLVAWARWTVRGERPRHWIALPDRAALSVGWRLWVAFSVFGAVDELLSFQASAIAARLGGSPQVVGFLVGHCIDVVLIALATALALRLIALALGDRTFDQGAALSRTRALWPGLPLGMILALLPFTAAGCAIDLLQWSLNLGALNPWTGVFFLGTAATGFGALIAGTTYAARVYDAVLDTDPHPDPQAQPEPNSGAVA